MLINVGRIIQSRNLSQQRKPFTVYRSEGQWQAGRWASTENEISMTGVVTVANQNDLVQLPEGERVTGVMCFHSTREIYTTRLGISDQEGGLSDQIAWNGQRYKVLAVFPWGDYGYWKALAVRMEAG